MQFFGSAHTWQSIDDIAFYDMQLIITCMNAYSAGQSVASEKSRIYSKLGITKAGAHL